MDDKSKAQTSHVIVGVTIILIIALIHAFRIGSVLNGKWYILYYSYASDIMIPIGFYFLVSVNEVHIRVLRKWPVKALTLFGLFTFSEIMQAFDIYFFGVTFDVLDIVMFAIGVTIAVLMDQVLFKRFVPYWDTNRLKSESD